MAGQSALTATTGITHMTALPMASMGLSGSPVASLSVPARGSAMAGDSADAVSVDEALVAADLAAGDLLADVGSIADAALSATAVSPRAAA